MTIISDETEGQGDESFIQLLTAEQLPLLHYIARLLGDVNEAHNVLQETNLVLWRKASDFQVGTKFSTWAHKVAYWQVMAYVRDHKRDRHVFSEEMVVQLSSVDVSESEDSEDRIALRHCLTRISAKNLDILRQRYENNVPIKALAEHLGKTPSAIKVGLMRIRQALMKCIQNQMAESQ